MIMKKVLLMLVALVATVTVSADAEKDGWTKSFAPVKDQADLAGLHTAVAGDGSVYASSTFDQNFQFAEKTVAADADGMLSSCIVKYDKEGAEQWAITLMGNCQIYAMVADADGTLYVAGQSKDVEVVCNGVSGDPQKIVNPTSDPWGTGEFSVDAYSAFIAKISKDGVFEKIKVLTPQTPEDIATSEIPMYIPDSDFPIDITPMELKIDGDKLYLSATYKGDLKEGNDQTIWEGSYFVLEGFMYVESPAMGVLSLNKADFTDIYSEAFIYLENNKTVEVQHYPEALTFFVKENKVHVAFIGFGNLYIHARNGGKPINFEITEDESGNKEHGLAFINTTNMETKIYHAAKHAKDAIPYKLMSSQVIKGTEDGDKVVLAGTFYGNFPLNENAAELSPITKEANTAFAAKMNFTNFTYGLDWAWVNDAESQATSMIVTGEEVHASTDAATYTLKTATGEVKTDKTKNKSYADAAIYEEYVATIAADGANVSVYSPYLQPSAINAAKGATAKGAAQFFNLNGQRVAAPQKGLYIVNGQKVVIK